MTWVKLDDRFCDNLKIAFRSDRAFRAYVTSLCYSSGALSDGVVPQGHADAYAGSRKVMDELVENGLWEPIPGGIRVHDYLDWQESRAGILAKRARDSARKNGGNPHGDA